MVGFILFSSFLRALMLPLSIFVLKRTMTFHQEKAFYKVKDKSKTFLFVPSRILCASSQWPYYLLYLRTLKVKFYCHFYKRETTFSKILKRTFFSSSQIKWNLKALASKDRMGFWITWLKKGKDPGTLNGRRQEVLPFPLVLICLSPGEREH